MTSPPTHDACSEASSHRPSQLTSRLLNGLFLELNQRVWISPELRPLAATFLASLLGGGLGAPHTTHVSALGLEAPAPSFPVL